MTFQLARCMEQPILNLRTGYSVVLTFMRHLTEPQEKAGTPTEAGFGIRLAELQRELTASAPDALRLLAEPIASFNLDIVHPAFAWEHMPLIFTPVPALEDPAESLPEVVLHRPAKTIYFAEGLRCELGCGPKRDVRFALREVCALFTAGHFAYSLVLTTPSDEIGCDHGIDEYILIQLQKLVHPTGGCESLRCGQFSTDDDRRDYLCFSGKGLAPCDLVGFVNSRLSALLKRRDSPFRKLLIDNVIPDVEALPAFAWKHLVGGAIFLENRDLCQYLTQLIRGEMEPIVGATDFPSPWRSHAEPSAGSVPGHLSLADGQSGQLSLVLAGVFQHVLDFPRQDEGEVSDSLKPLIMEDGWLVFNHPKIMFEVVDNSRSYRAMQRVIGCCPYFLLIHLAVSYNELLLREAAELMRQLHFMNGDQSASMRARFRAQPLGALAGALRSADRAFRNRTSRIVRDQIAVSLDIYRSTLMGFIPNIFRYYSEQLLYERIMEARGLKLQYNTLNADLSMLRQITHDIDNVAKTYSSRRLNQLVLALAILSLVTVVHAMDWATLSAMSTVQWLLLGLILTVGAAVFSLTMLGWLLPELGRLGRRLVDRLRRGG